MTSKAKIYAGMYNSMLKVACEIQIRRGTVALGRMAVTPSAELELVLYEPGEPGCKRTFDQGEALAIASWLVSTFGEAGTPPVEVQLEVIKERSRQIDEWGGPDHDDEHDAGDWFDFINKQCKSSYDESETAEKRERLVKIAALALAGIESIDRKEARDVGVMR